MRSFATCFIFVDLEYIHIFSQNMEEDTEHVRLVRLLENKVFVKAKNCEFSGLYHQTVVGEDRSS